MRKPFSTTIEETTQDEFKKQCSEKNSNLSMNTVLEALMEGYNKGDIKIELVVSQQEK